MKKMEIYTKSYCGFCHRAKALLQEKGIPFLEHDLTSHPELEPEMRKRSGRNTVPQIFLEGRHLGGCDDLYALEQSGELDRLLKS